MSKTLLDKFTDLVSWFVGSWTGVLIHAIWFSIWLYLDFSIESLTLAVSLEAIFIGIFLLMAANEAERARENREKQERSQDRNTLKEDVSLDEKQIRALTNLTKEINNIKQDLAEIKSRL